MLTIITSSDEKYVPHLVSMLKSIEDNLSSPCKVIIVDYGITEETLDRLKYFLKSLEKLKFHLVSFEKELSKYIENKNIILNHPATVLTYLPFLDVDTEKSVLIDVDVIVKGDISQMEFIDLDGKTIGAVPDSLLAFTDTKSEVFRDDELYFNSGVILVDVLKWKENNITQRILKLFEDKKYSESVFWEQDAYNFALKEDWKVLPFKFNYIDNGINYKPTRNLGIYKSLVEDDNFVIVHFAGPYKPWKYISVNKYSNDYWSFRQKTPWRESEFKKKILRFLNIPLIILIKTEIPMNVWRFFYGKGLYKSKVYRFLKKVRDLIFN